MQQQQQQPNGPLSKLSTLILKIGDKRSCGISKKEWDHEVRVGLEGTSWTSGMQAAVLRDPGNEMKAKWSKESGEIGRRTKYRSSCKLSFALILPLCLPHFAPTISLSVSEDVRQQELRNNKQIQYNVEVTFPITDFSQLKIAGDCSQKASNKCYFREPIFQKPPGGACLVL